jgi:ParB family transcriptional regulator, chromosome partitioning protein
MAKNSMDAYGAAGKTNLLLFNPEDLTIVTDEKHPLYDERVNLPLDEALVKNIMYHGVLEPVVVRKNAETGKTEVVDGRQRARACVAANKRLAARGEATHMLPAVVKRGEDSALSGMMVSTNELRQADTPMNRAKKMGRLLNMGKTEEDISVLFGISKATVKNTLGVLDCCGAVKKAVDDGKINVTAAYGLAKLPADEQKTTLAKMIAAGDGAKTKREKSRAQKEATGKKIAPSKKAIAEYREEFVQACTDSAYRDIVLPLIDYVLGDRKTPPKFPKGGEAVAAEE